MELFHHGKKNLFSIQKLGLYWFDYRHHLKNNYRSRSCVSGRHIEHIILCSTFIQHKKKWLKSLFNTISKGIWACSEIWLYACTWNPSLTTESIKMNLPRKLHLGLGTWYSSKNLTRTWRTLNFIKDKKRFLFIHDAMLSYLKMTSLIER